MSVSFSVEQAFGVPCGVELTQERERETQTSNRKTAAIHAKQIISSCRWECKATQLDRIIMLKSRNKWIYVEIDLFGALWCSHFEAIFQFNLLVCHISTLLSVCSKHISVLTIVKTVRCFSIYFHLLSDYFTLATNKPMQCYLKNLNWFSLSLSGFATLFNQRKRARAHTFQNWYTTHMPSQQQTMCVHIRFFFVAIKNVIEMRAKQVEKKCWKQLSHRHNHRRRQTIRWRWAKLLHCKWRSHVCQYMHIIWFNRNQNEYIQLIKFICAIWHFCFCFINIFLLLSLLFAV